MRSIFAVIAFLPILAFSATSIRCQCTKAYSGIPCYHSWCEVRSNATHIAACAVAKKNGSNTQTLACALVTERADEGKCQYDGKRNFTKCWCTRGDYCNVDLVDRIRDKRDDEEDDYDGFSVETNTEFNENNNDIGSDEDVEDSQEFRTGAPRDVVPERIDAVDMRKPVETKQPDPEDLALPPWRRMNPLNADREWKPPPPPPMPGKHPILPPTTTTSTTSTTTTTTTTTTAPPTTTTTTGPSYEEIMRQYEERRRQNEMQREAELKRRAEVERQRLEERRHLESQHEQRRRFGEETRNWPVAPMAPEAQDPTTTTSTTTRTMPTTTTTTTTTTTAPPTTTATTTTTTPRPTTTTKPAPKEEKSYESYYRNWKPHRRPLDLNPTQVSIQSVSAIVYPPKNFVKATKSTTSTTTTTTTPAPTTTTQPIIYPPANFKKATKLTSTTTTTTTTTTTPRTITTTEMAFTLPRSDDEDGDDEEMYEKERKMVEMPKVESEEVDSVVMYTPRPPPNRLPPPPPTPSVRTPVEKMDEYKKLLAAQEPSSSAVSMIIPSFISIIILYLL